MRLDLLTIVWNLGSIVLTVVLHAGGTVLIVEQRPRLFNFASHRRKVLRGQLVITIILIELLVLHLIEIGLWGLYLRGLGLFANLGPSLYFAGLSYTSLGYNGAVLSPVIGFNEVLIAMMGLPMFGWSTGILVTTVVRYEKVTLEWDVASDRPVKPDF